MSSRKALQIVVGVLALAPILLGLSGFLAGAARFQEAPDPTLDSALRFLFALEIGFGLAFYWILPNIEKRTGIFRILLGALFLDGIGRLISIYTVGIPTDRALIVLGIELLAPVICFPWQAIVARKEVAREGSKS